MAYLNQPAYNYLANMVIAYTVDMDGAYVLNLSDIQKGGLTLGTELKLGYATQILLLGGQ